MPFISRVAFFPTSNPKSNLQSARMNVYQLSRNAFFLIVISYLTTVAAAAEPLEDFMSATFRVADKSHSGTGFLVAAKKDDSQPANRVALVTAGHVFEQMPASRTDLMLRSEHAEKGYVRAAIAIPIRNGDKPRWARHPELDIAALWVDLPENIAAKPLAYEQLADEKCLLERRVKVGQEAWIPCFPAKLEANEAGWPVLRRGAIATHPLVPVKSAKTMLIDFTTFGGDSGAPVAVIQEERPLVVGLVLAMHRQSDKSTLPFEERTVHTPLGLSIVAQAVYIRETIELLMKLPQ